MTVSVAPEFILTLPTVAFEFTVGEPAFIITLVVASGTVPQLQFPVDILLSEYR
ncbi:MAG: hypothetical protein ABIO82_05795 [Ginsengibacter sp.]